ncbi:hypothetical protein ID866_10206 [Astraeus odoratus]|nr:hypothetical protein ID866_10206 [Astraeus odoratus]
MWMIPLASAKREIFYGMRNIKRLYHRTW